MPKCDFSGWATRNDLLCSDGRTIRKDAFLNNNGQTVPLVWNHQHDNPDAVLGHAMLENRTDGVYAYCTFNETESGVQAKELVQHGDVRSLSIYANQLKQIGNDVVHGNIRELSLVLAGANPGAFIDYAFAHGDGEEDTLIANWDENSLMIYHSEEKSEKEDKKEMADNKETKNETSDKTVQDVIDSMTEEQKQVMYAMVGHALEANEDEDMEDEEEMKHNVFDTDQEVIGGVISHADQEMILTNAKKCGSFREALNTYADDNSIQHDAIASGFAQANISRLFPEYHDVHSGAPELITDDQNWVNVVMNKIHKTPYNRIRTGQVDIRNIDALRARGYFKGKQKKLTGNYELVRRTTDPQTVYVKSALHRDDIIDITDFDIVKYQYDIDRAQLDMELALAALIGDGRASDSEDKIQEDKIRPIWTDDELYTRHYDIDVEAAKAELQGSDTNKHFGENYILAEAMVNACLYSREKYKGTGTPDMLITPHMLNVMLLARDMNGRRIYGTKAELASALNVNSIITVEQFEGKVRKDSDSKSHKLLAMIVNLADYSFGSTKGGEVTHFTQFDIDYNQQKSLLETRLCGALTRVYSAIVIEEPTTAASQGSEG